MSEKFNLKWNDFQSNVSKAFSALQNEDYLNDVTLVSEDHQHFSANKLALSSCSEYFKDIFRKSKHPHPLICLIGVSSNDLSNVLDYVYNGEVQIFQEELDHFLAIAEKLKLQGLLSIDNDKAEQNNFEERIEPKIEDYMVLKPTERNDEVLDERSTKENYNEALDEKILEQIQTDQEGNLKCGICGKASSTWKSKGKGSHIRTHIETHFEGLSFTCSMCPTILRSRESLRKHKYKHI